METCEVKIRDYIFRFKRLYWREEFAIKFEKNCDPYRTMLAHALLEVSGVPVKTPEDGMRVIASLPYPIMERVFKLWRASFPASRRFVTVGLYKAPDPDSYAHIIEKDEEQREEIADPAMQEVEQKFGSKQLEEAKAISRKILEASKLRGAVRASEDGE